MTPTVGNSSLETANKLLQQGKIQEAVAEYRRGIELMPDLSWHHYYLGEALTQLEDWEGAVQAYRQAISLGSNYLCYYRLGVALVKLELWDEAIATLNQGLELKPNYYKFYLPLGQALVHQQHGEAAIEAYGKAVALKPGVAEFNLQLGHLLRRQGRFTEAVGYLQQAADFQGDDPQLQLGLGVALVEAGTDLHRAEASLRRTLELQPDQGEAYFYLGKLEGLRERWDEALAMYRRSWEINPQVGEWGLALAEALEKLGRWSEAVDQYRQVVLELGESGEASLGLGRALVQLERPVEAVVELRRAVKLGVDRPEVHRLWAGVLVELGRWPEVVDQWHWLLERYPGAADIRRRLALALMGLGRWPEAAAQWGEYWRVAPGSGRGSVVDFRPELGTYGEIDHRQELSITGDLTVEFWLYLRRWPEGWTEIISKFVSDEQNEFCFRLKDGQRGQWYFGKGEAFAKPVDWVPQEDMRLHEWVHVACVRKVGEYGRIYFDGVLRREADWSGEPEAVGTEATVRLMAHSDGKRFNDGKLSELRMWHRARSADEIRQGMYEALTGDEPGLVGVWHGSDEGVLVDAVGHHDGRSVMADTGKERLRVGVCGWELSHNAAGRAYTLAQLYGGWAEVELIGCLFPRYGGQVWEPIRGTQIPCHTVTVADEGRFVEQALGLVLAHPYEVVHLSKPRIPNIVLGLLYKLVWDARVIVDIDDEELAFVKAEATVDWRELPPLRDLDSQEWTEIAAGLAQEFDKVRELDGAEAGDAEAGELLAAVVAEVLAVPGGGVSQGLDLLLQGLPAVESVKSALGDKGKIEQVRANDGLSDYFAYHRLGEALEELGRFDEAIEAYRRSVELQPEAAGSILSWSRVLRRVGRFDEAQLVRSRLTVAVSQVTSEGFDSVDVQGNGHYGRADINQKADSILWREKQDFSPGEIRKLLDPLYHWYLKIDKNPDNYWLYWRLGNALVNQGLLDNGLIFYKIGLRINPNSYELNLQLGKVLLLQNKFDRALVYLTKAQDLEPKSFEVNLNLARALENLNRLDEAVLCYQKALTVSPGNYFVIRQLAEIWESQGKHQEAIELYREVLERGYGNPGNDGRSDMDAVGTGFNKGVLFALHLSWPYQGTGYAVRSQHILKSLRGHGLKVLAATRWGYPQNLPGHRSRSIPAWDELEKIRYCRLGIGENDFSEHDWSYELIEQYAEGLVELAGSHQAMVIHGSSTFVNGLAAVLAARKLGVKSVYEIRGLWHLSRVSREPEFRNSYEYAYQQMMEENVARQADAVVVLSEVLKERVVSWGVSSDKITVVPNAVDLKEFYPREANSDLQEQFGLAGKFVIGFLGSLNGYEGVDVLIEAVKGLVTQGYEIVLMVVGGGLALKDLQALGVSGSGKENIVFTGRVPFSQMLDYYSVCDLCVFPRRNDEVCRYVPPLKVLEPMAMGKPVIVSNLSPLVEMVEDEKTGLVFRCGDVEGLMSQILRVYRDEELRRGLGREARSWVERYRSWDEVSQRYLGVYESLFAVRSL